MRVFSSSTHSQKPQSHFFKAVESFPLRSVIPLSSALVSVAEDQAETVSLSRTAQSEHDALSQISSRSETVDTKSNSFRQALFLAGAIALVFGAAVLLPIALFSEVFFSPVSRRNHFHFGCGTHPHGGHT